MSDNNDSDSYIEKGKLLRINFKQDVYYKNLTNIQKQQIFLMQ